MPKKTAASPSTVDPEATAAIQATPSGADLPAAADNPSREEAIRKAAYAAYQQRGDGPGSEVDDWLAAERQLDDKG